MNGWWFAACCFGLFLIYSLIVSRRNKRQVAAFAATRASPDREAFVALLSGDCEPDIAEFVWTIFIEEYFYWGVEITPHPDDDYLEGMPIDPENQQDWVGDFCDREKLRPKDFPHWPEGQKTIVRNFARWLSEARQSMMQAAA